MILSATLFSFVLAPPHVLAPPNDVSLLSLDSAGRQLDLYRIHSGNTGSPIKLIPVKRIVLDPPTDTVVMHRLSVSPDGKRVALVLQAPKGANSTALNSNELEFNAKEPQPRGVLIRVLDTSNLRTVYTRKLPSAVALQWSPRADTIAYQTATGSVGLLGVASGIPNREPMAATTLLWDRQGHQLFLSVGGLMSHTKLDARWTRVPVQGGTTSTVRTQQVIRETWLANATPEDRKWIMANFAPDSVWSVHGLFVPIVDSGPEIPQVTRDLFFRGGRPILITRPGAISFGLSTQFISSSSEIVYAQSFVLFDRREAPDGSVWLGRLRTGDKKTNQWLAKLPVTNVREIALVKNQD